MERRSRFVGLKRTLGGTSLIDSKIRTGVIVRSNRIAMGNRARLREKGGLRSKSIFSCSNRAIGIIGW